MLLKRKTGRKPINWIGLGMPFWSWLAGRLIRLRKSFEQPETLARNLQISCEPPTTS
jgi:hypothetical protein